MEWWRCWLSRLLHVMHTTSNFTAKWLSLDHAFQQGPQLCHHSIPDCHRSHFASLGPFALRRGAVPKGHTSEDCHTSGCLTPREAYSPGRLIMGVALDARLSSACVAARSPQLACCRAPPCGTSGSGTPQQSSCWVTAVRTSPNHCQTAWETEWLRVASCMRRL